jgi:hypothetical protein
MPGKKLYVHPLDREYDPGPSSGAPPISPTEGSAGKETRDEPDFLPPPPETGGAS